MGSFLTIGGMFKMKKLIDGIRKPCQFTDESNSLLLLSRYLLLILIPYDLLMSIYSAIRHFNRYALVLLFASIAYALIFSASYQTKPRYMAHLLCVVAIISTSILTMGYGWRCSFQNLIYITFLIIWYDALRSVKSKIVSSIIISTIISVLSIATPFGETLIDPATLEYKLLVAFNILIFAICLSLVAFFYCTQYVEVERNLRIYNRQLKQMSETDTLTKLVNRRFAEREFNELDNKSNLELISIAIGDIDFFKRINDTYGHECGDYVLSTVATIFKNTMSKKGFVARWGGEEFIFMFENRNGDDAFVELEKLRKEISNYPFQYCNNKFNITMTFGLEEYNNKDTAIKTIESADKKLYQGKESGRNCVVY